MPDSPRPPAEPSAERPDQDRSERYTLRRVWLPDRPHRGGRVGGGDMDFMNDESLYRPSLLGSAAAAPTEVAAGAESGLTLTYQVGPAGLPQGAHVEWNMRGQAPLGRAWRREDLVLSGPAHARLEPLPLGFAVAEGALREGDRVELTLPPWRWTPLAGRREFVVAVTLGDGSPERHLPEPVVIWVRPLTPERIEATLPATHRPNQPLCARITLRDRYDNRVPDQGTVRLRWNDREATACMVGGLADCPVPAEGTCVVRAEALHQSTGLAAVTNPSVPSPDVQLYIGDLHCHDLLSEAEAYPDAVYRWAREDRNLDFVCVSPQAHGWLDNQTWTIAKYMAERHLEEGRFVTLLGYEWQHTGYGDKVIHYLGGDQPYLPVDDPRYSTPAGLYRALRDSDALTIAHHTCYPPNRWCPATDWDSVETDVERLVELWSMHGSSEGYDPGDRPLVEHDPAHSAMVALRRGLRLGFVAGSDTHSGRPGGSAKEPRPYWGGLAAVWARELTRRALFEALSARRTYALTGARIVLRFTVNGAPMGSELPAADRAEIRVDAWAPARIARVEVLKNTLRWRVEHPSSDECHLEMEDALGGAPPTGGAAFYHCRVTLEDGHLAVCSPVWVG